MPMSYIERGKSNNGRILRKWPCCLEKYEINVEGIGKYSEKSLMRNKGCKFGGNGEFLFVLLNILAKVATYTAKAQSCFLLYQFDVDGFLRINY